MRIKSRLLTEGLWGQLLIWVLEILPFVDSQGTGGSFLIRSRNYGQPPEYDCISPYLIELVPDQSTESPMYDLQAIKARFSYQYAATDFAMASKLWSKYLTFRSFLTDEADQFVQEHFANKYVLGLHWRGIDKMQGIARQATEMTYADFMSIVDEYLNKKKNDQPGATTTTIFVTTDDDNFLQHVVKHFQRRVEVVYRRDSARNQDLAGRPVFFAESANRQSAALDPVGLGTDAIVNVLLLAQCNVVLKTASQLSAWAKIFNPDLEIWRVNAFHCDWFPDSAIPLYASSDKTVQAILHRIQVGEGCQV